MVSQRRVGFTLIEVLIVVVIMAVLASTIIPQFTASAEDAKRSTLEFNLSSMRSAIERYKHDHAGALPAVAGGTLPQLVGSTDEAGTVGAAGASFPLGPYMTEIPKNPLNGNTDTVTEESSWPPSGETAAGGWFFNPTTGQILPNSDEYL